MTKKEFDTTPWTGNMKAIFKGSEYEILSVDFEDKTIDLIDADGIVTVNCEQVYLLEE